MCLRDDSYVFPYSRWLTWMDDDMRRGRPTVHKSVWRSHCDFSWGWATHISTEVAAKCQLGSSSISWSRRFYRVLLVWVAWFRQWKILLVKKWHLRTNGKKSIEKNRRVTTSGCSSWESFVDDAKMKEALFLMQLTLSSTPNSKTYKYVCWTSEQILVKKRERIQN